MQVPISVEIRVVATIWKWATTAEYCTLAACFGLGRSTVGQIVIDTYTAIMDYLPSSRIVKVSDGTHLNWIVDGFKDVWDFPQAAGAIDGTHISNKVEGNVASCVVVHNVYEQTVR